MITNLWLSYYEYCGDIPPVELENGYYAHYRAQPTAEPSNRYVPGHQGRFTISVTTALMFVSERFFTGNLYITN